MVLGNILNLRRMSRRFNDVIISNIILLCNVVKILVVRLGCSYFKKLYGVYEYFLRFLCRNWVGGLEYRKVENLGSSGIDIIVSIFW